MSLAWLVAGFVVAADFAAAVVAVVAVVAAAAAAKNEPFVEHLKSLATPVDRAPVLAETADFELGPGLLALALELGERFGS